MSRNLAFQHVRGLTEPKIEEEISWLIRDRTAAPVSYMPARWGLRIALVADRASRIIVLSSSYFIYQH